MAEDHQQVGFEGGEGVVEGGQDGVVKNVARGADDKGIAEANIENVLDRGAGIGTGNDHHAGILTMGQALAVINLAHVDGLAVQHALISRLKGLPYGLRFVGNIT